MKKWLSILLVAVVVFSLFGCDGRRLAASGGNGRGDVMVDTPIVTAPNGGAPAETAPTEGAIGETMPTAPTEPEVPGGVEDGADPSVPDAEAYYITVWVPEEMVEITERQIQRFNETNGYGFYFQANVEIASAQEAPTYMIAAPEQGADLFFFSPERMEQLIYVGALTQLDARTQKQITGRHDAFSVSAASYYGDMYAYPTAINNGYFMYYDKSVISESDLGSLEALLAACEANNRRFSFNITNGWYNSAFFFGTGCVSEWQIDAEGNIISVVDNFNSEMGIAALAGIRTLMRSHSFYDSATTGDFNSNIRSAVVICGSWDYAQAKDILGDNLGVAELPSFHYNGESYHLTGFGGSVLLGVKPQTEERKADALSLLAQYLTDEECQLERMACNNSWVPTHLSARRAEIVQNDPCALAMIAQSRHMVQMGEIHGKWWDIAANIPEWLFSGITPWDVLSYYSEQLQQIFVEYTGWTVVGFVNGSKWDVDFEMEEQPNGMYRTVDMLKFDEGSEYKIRWGRSWDENYGKDGTFNGPNCIPVVVGYYYVWFDPSTGVSWLEPAE